MSETAQPYHYFAAAVTDNGGIERLDDSEQI